VAKTKPGKKQVVVKKTGHPASITKMRCTGCGQGYAILQQDGTYLCGRCGHRVTSTRM
jgi:predicted RNA-binding Zn-ribbon protein involved in translation (DUF1610 family)